jgi:hypothetical protein
VSLGFLFDFTLSDCVLKEWLYIVKLLFVATFAKLVDQIEVGQSKLGQISFWGNDNDLSTLMQFVNNWFAMMDRFIFDPFFPV